MKTKEISTELYFEVTSTILKTKEISTILCFEVTSTTLKIKNSSTDPSYLLNTYSEAFPFFRVLLDFIDNYGGIY